MRVNRNVGGNSDAVRYRRVTATQYATARTARMCGSGRCYFFANGRSRSLSAAFSPRSRLAFIQFFTAPV